MATPRLGLTSILLGPVGANGGMGTVLVQLGDTVEGTPTFSQADPTKVDFKTEESDNPYYSIVTSAGKRSFSWSSYQIDAATMVKFFGGNRLPGPPEQWQSPTAAPELEMSMRLTWKNGGSIDFPRVKVNAKNAFSFQKGKVSQIDLVADILTPTLAGTPDTTATFL